MSKTLVFRSKLKRLRILTIRLLEARSCTSSSELLGLATTRISHEECSIITGEGISDLLLRNLVHILLVEGNESLGYGLANGIDLRGVSTSFDADAHVYTCKAGAGPARRPCSGGFQAPPVRWGIH